MSEVPTPEASLPVLATISPEDESLVIEFISKGYTDEDIYHILPAIAVEDLEALKARNIDLILRTSRDYCLINKQTDDTMDELESVVLDKLRDALVMEVDAMKLTKIFQTINGAKRKSRAEVKGQDSSSVTNNIVVEQMAVLQMPTRMLEKAPVDFETNSNNEVIRVGKTLMSTATNTQVLEQLKRTRESSEQELLDGI